MHGLRSFKSRMSFRSHLSATSPAVAIPATQTKPYTLVDAPVSNNGARIRFVVYKKKLTELINTVGVQHFGGGLKSKEYLTLNPQGKFPLLVLPTGQPLPESEVIVQYLIDKYHDQGDSLVAATPEARAVGTLVTRIHDLYIVPIQSCMYRAMPSAEQRAENLAQLAYQLDAIEQCMVGGPFITGPAITTADGALFPTMVFLTHILPKHFGWTDVFAGRPKLAAWWDAVKQDPEACKVIAEVQGGLDSWEAANRWQVQGITEQIANNPHLKWSF